MLFVSQTSFSMSDPRCNVRPLEFRLLLVEKRCVW